jgi:predicted phage tail protein
MFLSEVGLILDMAKELALNKLSEVAQEVNSSIQQQIGEMGLAQKINNEEPLNRAEREFLGNLNALSFEAEKVLKEDEEVLAQAANELETIIEMKKSTEEDAMKRIENGLKSFEGHLEELIEDSEGNAEEIPDLLDKLQHDQEGILEV